VDHLIEELITRELQDLISSKIRKQLIAGITDITNELITKHDVTINTTWTDELVLEAFTKLLNDVFQPSVPASIPNVYDTWYNWTLSLVFQKNYTIDEISFGVGDSAWASLEFDCSEILQLYIGFNFTLGISRTEGVRIFFPYNPVLKVLVGLYISQQCELSGNIGFLGAELLPRGKMEGLLLVDKTNDSKCF